MGWGGGGGMMGGGGMGGGQGHSGNPGGGLPFAGIPPEMQKRVEELVADEPEWPTPDSTFSHRMTQRGVSLRRMLRPHRRLMGIATVLVVIEALTIQLGPLLASIGIDDGIKKDDWSVILACAIAAVIAVVISAVASGFRVGITGRIASRVMFELRVRVFAHLQRLSLDYYTEREGGRDHDPHHE